MSDSSKQDGALISQINAQREMVVAEARSWLLTPYLHMGRVKGSRGGVDCAMLLAEVYERAGMIKHLEVERYPQDWHFHRAAERFMQQIIDQGAFETTAPQTGDLALFKFGKAYSHGAIVVEWPMCIHANMTSRIVEYVDAARNPHLSRCATKYFTLWRG